MTRIVFEFPIQADPKQVLAALDTHEGVAGWWSKDLSFTGGVGAVMRIGFPGRAPAPFELLVEEAGEQRVRWRNVGAFPPHWAGTEIVWTMTPSADGLATTVHFSHDGWASDEGAFPAAAMTWGQLMGSLTGWVETGTGNPLYG